jgi:signal transduction histidine kinase
MVTITARVSGSNERIREGTGKVSEFAPLCPQSTLLEFEVADTGVGIPSDRLSKIFDKFYQVDSSETRRFGGVGIGLYIAKKFAERLGGRITVESREGSGSKFTLTVPCESAAENFSEATAHPSPAP